MYFWIMSQHAPKPLVVYANDFQFAPGQVLGPRVVQSRMFLWARRGHGVLTVDGMDVPFPPGTWALLPWCHNITYQADRQDPLMIGGFHLVPHCPDGPGPHGWRIHHDDLDPLPRWPGRHDAALPGLPAGLVGGTAEAVSRLLLLGDYVVRFFQETGPDLEAMADLARVAVRAMAEAHRQAEHHPLPADLARACQFASLRPQALFTIQDLAAVAGVSPPTLTRRFRRHLGCSPKQWLLTMHLDRAAHLLATTSEPVAVIAARVGFEDPFHFSRLFKRHRGISPSEHRRRSPV